jgi:two-component system, NtrC family, response regulator PilR
MASEAEHNVAASPASNRQGHALHSVLKAVLDATGWERAFLVTARERGDEEPARVEASLSLRRDGCRTASRTVLTRAFATAGTLVCTDARNDPSLANGTSVRALDVRAVVSVPVAASEGAAALVVDHRVVRDRVSEHTLRLLRAFAEVLAALGRASAPEPRPAGAVALNLVGRSACFVETLAWARRVARTKLPVLLVGETGTGKEEIARMIHRESPRASAPFIAVNCAALPETLLESELFGAVRGAYTGAERDRPGLFRLAQGGTVLLDEVGDMPPQMQAKVLRALQDGKARPVGGAAETAVDVRIVAATHRDLVSLVAEGGFRADLYWRLAMAEVRVPSLRERPEDIPLLVDHLLRRLLVDEGAAADARIHPSAVESLRACDWPGNVRQLQAVLARGLLRCGGGTLTATHLDLPIPGARFSGTPGTAPPLERRWIEEALSDARWNLTQAAARIGWSRQKLHRRMRALGVSRSSASRCGADGCR